MSSRSSRSHSDRKICSVFLRRKRLGALSSRVTQLETRWTKEEDDKLHTLVKKYGSSSWTSVSLYFNGEKSNIDCCQRWQLLQNPELVKGPWTKEEDQLEVKELVPRYGVKSWSCIARHVRTRNGKQCRERWCNHLNPSLKKSSWTQEEDAVLMQAQKQLGNRWAAISKLLPGRSDNCIKNRWYSSLKRWVKKKSHSPVTSTCGTAPRTGRPQCTDSILSPETCSGDPRGGPPSDQSLEGSSLSQVVGMEMNPEVLNFIMTSSSTPIPTFNRGDYGLHCNVKTPEVLREVMRTLSESDAQMPTPLGIKETWRDDSTGQTSSVSAMLSPSQDIEATNPAVNSFSSSHIADIPVNFLSPWNSVKAMKALCFSPSEFLSCSDADVPVLLHPTGTSQMPTEDRATIMTLLEKQPLTPSPLTLSRKLNEAAGCSSWISPKLDDRNMEGVSQVSNSSSVIQGESMLYPDRSSVSNEWGVGFGDLTCFLFDGRVEEWCDRHPLDDPDFSVYPARRLDSLELFSFGRTDDQLI